MAKSSWSGLIARAALLLGMTLVPAVLSAQNDSIALPDLLAQWRTQNQLQIAYDQQKAAAIRLPQAWAELPPEEAFTQIENTFGLCFERERPRHYLLLTCERASWDLSGEVRDAKTGESLPYATVRLSGQPLGTLTDVSGRFHLEGLEGPEVPIVVQYVGYAADTLLVKARSGPLRVGLQQKDYALSKVEINTFMDVVDLEEEYGAVAIETDRLPSLPSIAGPDPLNSIRMLPGVGGNPESGSGIVMRGSKFDQTMILYDQVPVLQVDHFFGLFSSINQRNVKDIRVYRSGYSAKYSGYAGGLVQITSRDGDLEGIRGGVEIDRNTTGFHLDLPIKKKFSSTFSYRLDNSFINYNWWSQSVAQNLLRERINASTPEVRADAARLADYFFADLNGKLVYRPNDRNRITLGVQFNWDNFTNELNYVGDSVDYKLDLDLDSEWQNAGGFLRWDHELGQRWKGSMQFSYSNFYSTTAFDSLLEVREGDTLQNLSGYFQDNTLTQIRYRYDLEKTASRNRKWLTGVELPILASGVELTQDFFFFFPDPQLLALPAAYLEHIWQIDQWRLQTGLRLSLDSFDGGLHPEPRLSISRRLNQRTRWRMNYGIYRQHAQQFLPAIREGLVPDFWLLADSSFSRVLRSHILATGISWQHKGWQVDLEAYAKDLRTTTEQFPELERLLPADTSFLSSLAFGESQVVGVDWMLARRFAKGTIWGGGNVLRTRNQSAQVGEAPYQPYYANTADFKTGLLWNWRQFELGLTWRWQGGRRTTVLSNVPVPGQFQPGNASFPDYHRLDAAITYRFKWRRYHGSLQNVFFNVYNRQNLRTAQYRLGPNNNLEQIPSGNLGFLYNLKLSLGF